MNNALKIDKIIVKSNNYINDNFISISIYIMKQKSLMIIL